MTQMEIFYADRPPERVDSPTLFLVSFDFPEASKRFNLWAEVVSHKGNVIYSAPIWEILGTEISEETFATESE